MNYHNLQKYGLSSRFIQEAAQYKGLYLARVAEQHHNIYKLIGEQGELQASVSGKVAFSAQNSSDFPAVGDWVLIDREDDQNGKAVIKHILERKSVFARKAAGKANDVQIIAVNIDLVFICISLNTDFNLRRLERYLTIAWESMAKPVIVLTKADLCKNIDFKLQEVSSVCFGTDVVVCSSMEENGYRDICTFITPGKTVAFIGSSGVGKSTLINLLMGQNVLATGEIRKDDKGRHTTTHRQLLLLPGGGIVIDTPGMRELQLESGNLSKSFTDIEELALNCKYKDCSHTAEPGCAVKKAIEEGKLSPKRLENFKKLQKEIGYANLNFRQLEQEKIKKMFGGKAEMKQAIRHIKNKNKR
ncbi:MAG TPA: ribosome small subunit-dependent GTPase A [Peptococcaceae bacterium]|nr:ribosome small subunit-dependent GTPase A [Peptococcaceae bacterium]